MLSLTFILIGKVFKVLPLISCSSIIIITVLIIQSLFYVLTKHLVTLGAVTNLPGRLFYAAKIALRIYNILVAVSILVLTTKPSDLIEALVRRVSRLNWLHLQLGAKLSQMMSTVDTIFDA